MSNVKVFEGNNIRAKWNDDEDKWYFIVEDAIGFLTESPEPDKYWAELKMKVYKDEGLELSSLCRKLKVIVSDNKIFKYDSADGADIVKIIEFIPSAKAEPFKNWLAKINNEMKVGDTEQNKEQKTKEVLQPVISGSDPSKPSPKLISTGDLEFDGKINAALKKGKFPNK